MGIVVIGGTPGSGKTTLARLLATQHPQGVHVATDVFFDFVAHKIDPSLPGSRQQNEVVVNAYCRAAAEYAAAGYEVLVEGVIGPWMLDRLASQWRSFEYVLLHVPLDIALARVSQREGQASATEAVVRRMHAQFERILGTSARHVIDTNGKSVDIVAAECLRRRSAGGFAV